MHRHRHRHGHHHLSISVLGAALVVSLLCTSAMCRAGWACMNAVLLTTDATRRLVAQAERAFEQGHYRQVIGLLTQDDVILQAGDQKLDLRRRRILAVSRLRLGSIRSAVVELSSLLVRAPDDPYLKTRLAEAYSMMSRGNGPKKAHEMLEELARADLVVDAEGYLALARLREEARNYSGRDQALERCRKMASDASICSLDG